jgi:hypothetical protein
LLQCALYAELTFNYVHFSDARTLHWENGRSEGISRGSGFWSTGGFSGPQPERGGDCLAILNNLYNDGIKFHDVSCEHRKATICE